MVDIKDIYENHFNKKSPYQIIDKHPPKSNSEKIALINYLIIENEKISDADINTIKWLLSDLSDNDYSSQLLLARLYRTGMLFKQDLDLALKYYKKAALYNSWARLELQIFLQNSQSKVLTANIEGLQVSNIAKKRLAISNVSLDNIDIITTRFPFFNYYLVGVIDSNIDFNVDYYSPFSLLDCKEYFELRLLCSQDSEQSISECISLSLYSDKERINTETIKCCFGNKNADKVIHVLVPSPGQGILSIREVFFNIKQILKQKSENVIIYCDLQNYPSTCISFEELGKYNPWDYYFEQFDDINIYDVYSSANVIFWRINNHNIIPPLPSCKVDVKFSSRLKNKLEEISNNLNISKTRTIGIQARGTDYISIKPKGHLIPFDEYELSEILDSYIESNPSINIYVSTEDIDIFNYLSSRFPGKLISLNQKRYSKKAGALNIEYEVMAQKPFDKLLHAENYLLATLLFSNCKKILATAGTAISLIREICDCPIIYCRKSKWGSFGKTPVYCKSIGKNHIELSNPSALDFTIKANSKIVLEKDCFIIHSLSTSNLFYLSIYSVPDKITVDVDIVLKNGSQYYKNYSKALKLSTEAIGFKLIIINDTKDDIECRLQIQLEKNQPSSYEPFHSSDTIIPMMDRYGNEIILTENSIVNFDKKIVTIQNNDVYLHSDSLTLFNNVICFPSGSIELSSMHTNNLIGYPDSLLSLPFTYYDGYYHHSNGNYKLSSEIFRICSHFNDVNSRKFVIMNYKHVNLNPVDLIHYCFDVANCNSNWTKNALDCLYRINSVDSLKVMAQICSRESENGDSECLGWMGRFYRDGKILPSDYSLSINYLYKASVINPNWIPEFVDLVIKTESTEYYSIIFSLCEKAANKKYLPCMARLGLLFRDGIGTEVNELLALKWFEEASKLDKGYSKLYNDLSYKIKKKRDSLNK